MKILKFGKGIDPTNAVARILGSGFEIVEFDSKVPPIEQVREAEVLLLRDTPVPADIIDAAPRLKLLHRFGSQLMGVDIGHATGKGIFVARIPTSQTGSSEMVAEHALFLMMALAKQYKKSLASIANRRTGVPKTNSMGGKTLGIIGVGKSGEALVPMARGLGMRVIGTTLEPDAARQERLGMSFLGDASSTNKVLAESDFVTVHLSSDASTNGFFDADRFAAMKKGSYLINIARGAIVEREALVESLKSGHLAGFASDVLWDEPVDPDDPLLAMDNVIATPHIAAATHEAQDRLAALVAENIRLVADGQTPKYAVTG
ncbi:MAG: hypothetical protein M9924_03775 [Rhizobiaceae bacterium]|nr:hypothetical protein [Rhizobiaceae bacterium]